MINISIININNLPNEIIVHILSYLTYVKVPGYKQPDTMTLIDDGKTRSSQILNPDNTFNKNGLLNPDYIPLYENTEALKNFMVNRRITNIIINYGMNVLYFKKNIKSYAIKKYKPEYIIAPNDTYCHDGHALLMDYGLIYLYLRSNKNIEDCGLERIAKIDQLQYLNIRSAEYITNIGLKHLHKLKYLKMIWCRDATNDGIIHMKDLTHLIMPFNYNLTTYIKKMIPSIVYVDAPEYNKYIKYHGINITKNI